MAGRQVLDDDKRHARVRRDGAEVRDGVEGPCGESRTGDATLRALRHRVCGKLRTPPHIPRARVLECAPGAQGAQKVMPPYGRQIPEGQ